MEPSPPGIAAGAHQELGGREGRASRPDLPGAGGKSRPAAVATLPTRGP